MRGHTRPNLTPRILRFWTLTRYPNYTVVYRPDMDPLQIIAVLHGKRNVRRILKQRPYCVTKDGALFRIFLDLAAFTAAPQAPHLAHPSPCFVKP